VGKQFLHRSLIGLIIGNVRFDFLVR